MKPPPYPDRVTVDRCVLHDLLLYVPEATLHAMEHQLDERPDPATVLAHRTATANVQLANVRARLARVQAIHRPEDDRPSSYCAEDAQPWPCLTARVLDLPTDPTPESDRLRALRPDATGEA